MPIEGHRAAKSLVMKCSLLSIGILFETPYEKIQCTNNTTATNSGATSDTGATLVRLLFRFATTVTDRLSCEVLLRSPRTSIPIVASGLPCGNHRSHFGICWMACACDMNHTAACSCIHLLQCVANKNFAELVVGPPRHGCPAKIGWSSK